MAKTGVEVFASRAKFGRGNLNGTPKQQAGAKDPFPTPASGSAKGRMNTKRPNLNTPKVNTSLTHAGQASGSNFAKSAAAAHAKKIVAGKGGSGAGADTTSIEDMTPAQIRAEAVKNISAGYKSSYGDLKGQSKQEQAIAAKQAQDNKAYEAWVGAQTQSILASGSAADAQYSAQAAAANQSLAQATAGDSQEAVAAANSRQGNVSNNAASAPLTTQLVDKDNLDKANQAIVNESAVNTVENSGDMLKSSAINSESRLGDAIGAQQGAFNDAMAKIAQAHTQLNLSKIGDIQKEVARLQGVQVQVQAADAQNQIAEQAYGLNVKTEADAHQAAEDTIAANIKIAGLSAKKYFAGLNNARAIAKYDQLSENQRAQLSANTSLSEANQRAALENKNYLLNVQKVGIAKASAIWKEQHPTAGSTTPNLHPDGSPLTTSEETSWYNNIDTTRGTINGLLTAYGTDPKKGEKIYQSLLHGTTITTTKDGKPVTLWSGAPIAPVLLNAAFDLSQARSGLTPAEIASLRTIGLRNISSHYRLAH